MRGDKKHSQAHVEDTHHLFVSNRPGIPDESENRRNPPHGAPQPCGAVTGKNPAEVARDASAGYVGYPAEESHLHKRVDLFEIVGVGLKERSTQGLSPSRRRGVKFQTAPLEEHFSGKAVAVGVEPV